MTEHLPNKGEPLTLFPVLNKPVVVVYTVIPAFEREMEAGGSEVQGQSQSKSKASPGQSQSESKASPGQSQLQSEFQASPSYMGPC